jgi:heme/copper-type cytochrome/quinol oxidase subunit 2
MRQRDTRRVTSLVTAGSNRHNEGEIMFTLLVWMLTILFLVLFAMTVAAVWRATGKSRSAAIRDAQAQHGLGANPRPENQNGYVTPYRS